VIEARPRAQRAVVNVQGRKEDSSRLARGKLHRHRVNRLLFAFPELENGEAEVTVFRPRIPQLFGQPKARIETVEIRDARYERSLERADVVHDQPRLRRDPERKPAALGRRHQ